MIFGISKTKWLKYIIFSVELIIFLFNMLLWTLTFKGSQSSAYVRLMMVFLKHPNTHFSFGRVIVISDIWLEILYTQLMGEKCPDGFNNTLPLCLLNVIKGGLTWPPRALHKQYRLLLLVVVFYLILRENNSSNAFITSYIHFCFS